MLTNLPKRFWFIAFIKRSTNRPLKIKHQWKIFDAEREFIPNPQLCEKRETLVALIIILFIEYGVTGVELVLGMKVSPEIPPISYNWGIVMGIPGILYLPGICCGYLAVPEAKDQTIALIEKPFVNQRKAAEERKKGVGSNGITIKIAVWFI